MREQTIGGRRGQRLVTFADNLVMVADAAGPTLTAWTDPVPMRGADRLSGVANVHYMFGASAQQLIIEAYGSDDGTSWIGAAALLTITSATPAAQRLLTSRVVFEFLRLKYQFEGTGSGIVVASLDVHATVDKS